MRELKRGNITYSSVVSYLKERLKRNTSWYKEEMVDLVIKGNKASGLIKRKYIRKGYGTVIYYFEVDYVVERTWVGDYISGTLREQMTDKDLIEEIPEWARRRVQLGKRK